MYKIRRILRVFWAYSYLVTELVIIPDFVHPQDTGGGITAIHAVGIVWGCQHLGQVVPVYEYIVI